MIQYMTIPEAAILWRTTPESVRQACESHRINGAVRFGRSWWIPEALQQPEAVRPMIADLAVIPFAAESHYPNRQNANKREI